MNNNRGGNNRRRGRGNSPRPQGAGGGQQVNRIDSRARGNAPQMLEKYRKLANDAHLNGDRVNAEYYLQFADHYFRVIGDTRVRQEEQRLRRDDRWQEGGEEGRDEGDESGDFNVESDFPTFDQPPVYTRREREDRPERSPDRAPEDRGQDGTQNLAQNGAREAGRDGNSRDDRGPDRTPAQDYGRRDQRPARNEEPGAGSDENGAGDGKVDAGSAGDADGAQSPYEPVENPFLRESRSGRGLRPRREDRRPRRDDRAETTVPDERNEPDGQVAATTPAIRRGRGPVPAGIDPAILPPAFAKPRDEPAAVAEDEPAPAPRRRARRKPAADDTGEPVESLA